MKVALRVDASGAIGTGHFMRCLTLAAELRSRGAQDICFCGHIPGHLRLKLDELSIRHVPVDAMAGSGAAPEAHWEHDAERTLAAFAGATFDWLVVDHYGLDERWERKVRSAAANVMVIDDLADRRHDCEILLDQNLHSNGVQRYRGLVPPACHLLLGPRFALLRPEFRQLRGHSAARRGAVGRVLVSFGGVDADNRTEAAVNALAAIGSPSWKVDVVIGAGHPSPDAVRAACHAAGHALHVQTDRMAELIAAADLAVGAGGITIWERACLGLPSLVVCTAENQRQQITDAAEQGLLYAPADGDAIEYMLRRHLPALLENPALRASLSTRGMSLVDGEGVTRVARQMGFTADIELRKAVQEDCQDIFNWRNHPSVRAASRNTDVLSWEEHSRWFGTVLDNPSRDLLIGMSEGRPTGVVRFDIADGIAEISIYLVPGTDGRSRGGELLAVAENWLRNRRRDVHAIRAEVLGDNKRSAGMFRSAGFEPERTFFAKGVRRP